MQITQSVHDNTWVAFVRTHREALLGSRSLVSTKRSKLRCDGLLGTASACAMSGVLDPLWRLGGWETLGVFADDGSNMSLGSSTRLGGWPAGNQDDGLVDHARLFGEADLARIRWSPEDLFALEAFARQL
eukprot:790205-Prorocentrum_minimum.AAC.1